MAGRAGPDDIAVVVGGAQPGLVGMAVITDVAADNMFGVLARGAAVVVAQHAFHRGPGELSADMTGGAVKKLVFAGQGKPGGEMIEAFIVFSGVSHRAAEY